MSEKTDASGKSKTPRTDKVIKHAHETFGDDHDAKMALLGICARTLETELNDALAERDEALRRIQLAGGYHMRTEREVEIREALDELGDREKDSADHAISELLELVDAGRNRVYTAEAERDEALRLLRSAKDSLERIQDYPSDFTSPENFYRNAEDTCKAILEQITKFLATLSVRPNDSACGQYADNVRTTLSEAFNLPDGSFVKHLEESEASGMSPEESSMMPTPASQDGRRIYGEGLAKDIANETDRSMTPTTASYGEPWHCESDWMHIRREGAPEIVEAHGLEWFRHDGSKERPCDGELLVNWMLSPELPPGLRYNLSSFRADRLYWHLIRAWRPADAPAKLPRK